MTEISKSTVALIESSRSRNKSPGCRRLIQATCLYRVAWVKRSVTQEFIPTLQLQALIESSRSRNKSPGYRRLIQATCRRRHQGYVTFTAMTHL